MDWESQIRDLWLDRWSHSLVHKGPKQQGVIYAKQSVDCALGRRKNWIDFKDKVNLVYEDRAFGRKVREAVRGLSLWCKAKFELICGEDQSLGQV